MQGRQRGTGQRRTGSQGRTSILGCRKRKRKTKMDGGTDGRVPHRVRVHACVRTHTVCVAPTLGIGILESAALAGMAPEEQGRRQMHLAYSGMPDLGAARESLLDGALTPCRNGHAGSACTVGRSTSSPRPMREVLLAAAREFEPFRRRAGYHRAARHLCWFSGWRWLPSAGWEMADSLVSRVACSMNKTLGSVVYA